MGKRTASRFPVLSPSLQVSFYHRLKALRSLYLDQALRLAVERSDLTTLNDQLASVVSKAHLARVASFGLRGEVLFATSYLLTIEPRLLGYYRLLLGLSQKEFFNKGPFGRFKTLEERGVLPEKLRTELPPLCRSLVATAQSLLDGIDQLSAATIHDLQLLTLGPQLRGSELTRLGRDATRRVYDLLRSVVGESVRSATTRRIELTNEAGRVVVIAFASDPDVSISERLAVRERPLVSVEIKGGEDVSNIHNRLGEAEKSHQKARQKGFFEFWTILGARVDAAKARRESPTTGHFFQIDQICDRSSQQHRDFVEQVRAMLGLRHD